MHYIQNRIKNSSRNGRGRDIHIWRFSQVIFDVFYWCRCGLVFQILNNTWMSHVLEHVERRASDIKRQLEERIFKDFANVTSN